MLALRLAGLAAILALLLWFIANALGNLHARGIAMGFDFLGRAARFPVSESILPYSPTDSFAWAFTVGLGNTLFLSGIVILSSTLAGFGLALMRRSGNPLASGLGTAYVDLVRNTPLVVQLLFWYAAVIYGLPHSDAAAGPIAGVYLTDRGLYLPKPIVGGHPLLFLSCLAAIIPVAVWTRRRGVSPLRRIGLALILCLIAGAATLSIRFETPVLGRFNFTGGLTLTPELVAVTLGLVLYSSAFTAEIIRAGIDAVPHGQWEAANALGLSPRDTMRRIILPQALRIIIPPMASQYINIVKNSTLGLVVGYPEINFVTATTINQSGQAIEGIAILMATFLLISFATSFALDRLNARVALVER